jgi:hypothetical protein
MKCMLARWQLSTALDGGRPSAWCTAHVARCARCAAHARRLTALHQRLALGAGTAAAPLEQRPRAAWLRAPVLAGGLSLAAVAAIAVYVARPDPSAPDERTAEAPALSEQTSDASPEPTDTTGDGRIARVLVEPVAIALRAEPLHTELEALASDGLRGARAVLAAGGLDGLLRAERGEDATRP